MTVHEFTLYALIASICWLLAIGCNHLPYDKPLKRFGIAFTEAGLGVLTVYLAQLWLHLDRPPMRTLGETRLWYAVLLPLTGVLVQVFWRITWLSTYSVLMAMLFLSLNIINPEVLDRTLMPALQSPWFVPHVVVYIEAYALLAASALIAARGLVLMRLGRCDAQVLQVADSVVYLGYGFLTMGLIFGAVWAKEAWGHYWTWDPKETWALLTWLVYLVYIHVRAHHQSAHKEALSLLTWGFVVLLLCWFGVNYLPAGQSSVHVYAQ